MKYRVGLKTPSSLVLLRGSANRGLTCDEVVKIVDDLQSDSRTAIGRAGTNAYRFNRKYPNGWYLCPLVDK